MIFFYEAYVVPGSILLSLIFAIINYSRLDNSHKVILFFLIFSALLNGLATFLALSGMSNLVIFHIYTIFEFAFISWFYMLQLKGLSVKIIPVLIGLFTIACIINSLFIQKKDEFNTYTRSIEAIIIISYCIILFSKQSLVENKVSWGRISINWINTGILVYYSGCFFSFIFSNYLLNASRTVNNIIWCTNDTILLFEYILFAVGFYQCKKQPITSSY
jgi:hypothetical protein